jgi:4-amino-4-deoxy-L-arabinose transferase-like glycosyltransferase
MKKTRDTTIVWMFALAVALFHLAANGLTAYGFHRDELYYLACADHPAFGYVDHPSLSILLLSVFRSIAGDSLFAVRILPAVSAALVILIVGAITAELGGRRMAQVLACAATVSAPLVLGMDSMFSMNAFDTLFWTAAVLCVVRLIATGEQKYWFLMALMLGLGLENKISVLWLGAGIVVAFLLTSHRRWFLRSGPWIACGIIALLFLPYVLWNVVNGFPTLEFMRNAGSGKYAALSPVDIFVQQTLFMNPLTAPLWIGGVVYVLVAGEVRRFRPLPLIYLTVFAILALNVNSKAAYLVTLIPMLFAMGGVAGEKLLDRFRTIWPGHAYAVVVLVAGLLLAPFVVALLPVDSYIRYAAWVGLAPHTSESNKLGVLPQHFADMFGWEEFAADIAGVWQALPPDDRAGCTILCGNYGEAGAIDHFGRRYGLPRAISGHNTYWFWGRGVAADGVVIIFGGNEQALRKKYASVAKAGVHTNAYSMPYESDQPIWVCRDRRVPLVEEWGRYQSFN